MSYELGGRSDKSGNKFEYNWTIYNLLRVIEEKIQYVMVESIGEDEDGVDLWVGNLDGSREGQQCKGRCGSDDSWSYGTINAKKIWDKWKRQLDRKEKIYVSLVSPLVFQQLEDLTERARTTNDNPFDFYHYQVNGDCVGKETKILYKNFCDKMGFDYSKEAGIAQSIDYLSRIYYRQWPDSELKSIVFEKINILFIGKPKDIYANLLELILTEKVWAKKIDLVFIDEFLRKQGIEYRNLTKDERILPRIQELNKEYHRSFNPFNSGLVVRREFEIFQKYINDGKSFIIYGDAGIGKSGCAENIISYCQKDHIPYLAIKLDKRIPSETSNRWGESMGLPDSPVFCLDAISKNTKAVLILDQLDALRWTQAHSGEALNVCFEIIHEIDGINRDREECISLVFVTRKYDLLNDRGISSLFEANTADNSWEKIEVQKLSEDDIRALTGEEYPKLSSKTKDLLANASNMYIWQHLDSNNDRFHFDTTRQLIHEWWKQLQNNAAKINMDSGSLIKYVNQMVLFCNKNGRISVLNSVLQIPENYLDYLQSNGFMIAINDVISFTHQSILDIFLSDQMVRDYYDRKEIIEIIGDKKRQIPGRRYQLQLFLNQVLQTSDRDFLRLGDSLLLSPDIRFNFKFVFLELLATLIDPSQKIKDYICKMTCDQYWKKYFIDSVVAGNKAYIHAIQSKGVIEKWLHSDDKKRIAIRLYASITPSISGDMIEVIKNYIFQDKDMMDEWWRCFYYRIEEESDDLFDLRMQIYEKYPHYMENYLDLKDMFKSCEIRTIKILAMMLKAKIKKDGKRIYKFEEEYVLEDTEIIVNEYMAIIHEILPLLPKVDEMVIYSDWNGRNSYHNGIERTCIQILKKANAQLANKEPAKFLQLYNQYMNTGNDLYNEIILDGLYHLSNEYADQIADYLCHDFNLTIFEETSGNQDKLLFGKRLLKKVSNECSDESFCRLEKQIIHFIDKDAADILQYRIDYYREHKQNIYRTFWGDFQRECLDCLPQERLSVEGQHLLEMFDRSKDTYHSQYKYIYDCSGWVSSPVANKSISYSAWKKIITNNELPCYSHKDKYINGCFIESSQVMFARSLEDAIKKEGLPFIEYLLKIEKPINTVFIERIYSAVSLYDQLNELDTGLLERLIETFGYDYEDHRAMDIVHIFERSNKVDWSEKALYVLKDIAMNHKNPGFDTDEDLLQSNKEVMNVESIEGRVYNSVRSGALQAIAELIWNNSNYATYFMEPIKKAISSDDPVMKYASLYAIWPIYNIDKQWALEQIITLYEYDIRMTGFRDTKQMLFYLYNDYKDRVINIVYRMFSSSDERVVKIAGYTISELYLYYDEYSEIIIGNYNFSETQKKAILEMLILYVSVEKYREKAKDALIHNLIDSFEIEYPWTKLFYERMVDLDKDESFIETVLLSVNGKRILYAFQEYMEESNNGLDRFKTLIIKICQNLVKSDALKDTNIWGYHDAISKLIISLYDACTDDIEDEDSMALQCLDIWDVMYERQIGMARELTKEMMKM